MYKHRPISPLIKVDRIAVLIALLILIVDSQHVSAQQQLAQDAYAIFEGSCLICHGPDGAYRETLLIDRPSMVANQTVVPGNPDSSELYKRLLGPTDRGAQMPLGQPQLSTAAIDTIRRWILAGAPDWTPTAAPLRRFVSPIEVLKAIDAHVKTISPFDRPYARYFTMTHLYNAGVPSDILGEYRKALAKLVNSLSWGLDIVNPQPIDPQQTIFYIDLRHYEWDRNAGWTEVEEAYPYHIEFNSRAQTALRNQLSRLQTALSTAVPSVNADWFIASAASPPLYNALLSLPETDVELEDRLEVDVANNILTAPGLRVSRAGFVNSGVSNHNRVVERHNSRYGAYWKSYDFAGSVGTQNIFTHPLAFTHDGGEIIFNLPNGLQGYYLVDGTGRRLDEAPISIVSNPAASDPTVRNGQSCIGCHTEGMKEFTDEVRAVIENDTRPSYNKAHALQLYVEKSEMDALVNGDLVRYQRALQSTGGDINDVEPVSRFHEAFHSPLDLHHASASVGLEPDVFLSNIRKNAGLQSAGLLVLDGGQIKRDTWRASFQDVIHALDYPQQVGKPPIVTQPEVIPGRLVDIPDPNLRALLEETLETKIIRPDTMAILKILRAKDRNIKDLTGLEFAVNLEEIWFRDIPVSDLSPLANCTNLTHLSLWGSWEASDISPLANLTKLQVLEHKGEIHDISPVANLTNLRELVFYTAGDSDISDVANLTKLVKLEFRHSDVQDITPLSRLVNLQHLDLHDNHISDISPLANLTKLRFLEVDNSKEGISDLRPLSNLTNLHVLRIHDNGLSDLSGLERLTQLRHLSAEQNHISNISPIAGLVNLEELFIYSNQISDVSPLARLVNLEELFIDNNQISDISVLGKLTNLNRVHVQDNLIHDLSPLWQLPDHCRMLFRRNPGTPKQGPVIQEPWLWIYTPGRSMDSKWERDGLSDISGGVVTETQIAINGATEGKAVGDQVWTSHQLPSTGENNVKDMFGDYEMNGIVYGNILLYSPRRQSILLYHQTFQRVKFWLNGEPIYQRDGMGSNYRRGRMEDEDRRFFPITLEQGKNVLLIAVDVQNNGEPSHTFIGFEQGTEYIVINPQPSILLFLKHLFMLVIRSRLM